MAAIAGTTSGAMRGAFLFALILLAGHVGPAPLVDTPPAAELCDPPPAPAGRHCHALPERPADPVNPLLRYPPGQGYRRT